MTVLLPAQSTLAQQPEADPQLVISALEEGGFQVTATLRIAAPPRVVWAVLTDCGQALRPPRHAPL